MTRHEVMNRDSGGNVAASEIVLVYDRGSI